ncbi:hypothetical protein [Streptomyces sp. NPDC092903]|uniref:hypothetical protein n=1 Tax=Streptomyces sp. NPDC092903 TaxID=3366017 RepID=UPI003817A5D1
MTWALFLFRLLRLCVEDSGGFARVHQVGPGLFGGEHPMTADEALDAAHRFLGDGYVEKGVNRGVFRSEDGLRQFRMDPDSIQGKHWPDVPHVHFEIFPESGAKKAAVNNHVPLIE